MNLLYKFFCLALCLPTLVMIPSCTDNNCNPKEVPQILKDWGYFGEGSYWIYQEEANGYEDSLWVFKDTTFYVSIDDFFSQPCEQTILSYFTSFNTKDTFLIDIVTYSSHVNLARANYDLLEFGGTCALTPDLPPNQGDKINQGPSGQFTVFDSVYGSYILNGDTFQDVVRANNNMNMAFRGTPTMFYYAKHVGLIQKDFPEYDLSWRLIRYHIKQ